jgi:hypothetical protein
MIIVRTTSPLHPSVSYPDASDFFRREDGCLEVLRTSTDPDGDSIDVVVGLHAPDTWEYARVAGDES